MNQQIFRCNKEKTQGILNIPEYFDEVTAKICNSKTGLDNFVQVIRGDKGRIETSLVPPWRVIEKQLTHLIKPLTPT